MTNPVTILYHADCLDGFGAAYAAWRRYGNTATYRPMHHGEPWNMADLAGHEVFILDFSFPPLPLEQMAGIARSVIQIDHHASALKDWATRVPEDSGAKHFAHPQLPLEVRFDLDKSGTRLAWEYFHPDEPTPLALRHIEDQDLWRFALPGTRFFCRALRLMPFEFDSWHSLVVEAPDPTSPRHIATIAQGTAIEIFFQREVERLAHGSLRMPARLRGEPVDALQALRHGQSIVTSDNQAWLALPGISVNANALFASELGNLLAEQSGTFGMVWQLAADGEIKVSLRSQDKNLDVSVIATRYGGGGHPNAAGFRLPAEQFFSEVLNMPATGTKIPQSQS